jgi:outer membrane protein TolC
MVTAASAPLLPLHAAWGNQRAQVAAASLPDPTLTLEEVVRTVEEQFPLLVVAQQEAALANADLLSAEGSFDPTLRARGTVVPFGPYPHERADIYFEQPTQLYGTRFFGGYRIGRGTFPIYDGKLETNAYGELRAGVAVPLLRNGPIDRARASIRRADFGIDAARLGVDQQRIEFVRVASLRYWDWVSAGQKLAVQRAMLELAVGRDAGLARRAEAGDIPMIDRNENLRAIAQREAFVVAASREIERTAIELSLYLRRIDGTTVIPPMSRLPGAIPEPLAPTSGELDQDVALALDRRPEPRRLALAREQTQIDLEFAKNQQKLGLDVFVAGSRDFGPGDPKLNKPELEAGVLIDIPLRTRIADGRVQAAEAGLTRVEAQTRFARDRITADVRDSRSALDAAATRVRVTRAEVKVALELEQAERKRFDLGDSTLLIVNLREAARAEASMREIDALSDYQKAVAQYRAATATNTVPTPPR